MTKIKIVYENLSSLNSYWIRPLVDAYFDFVPYSSNSSYDKKSTIFYVYTSDTKKTFLQFLDQGYSVVCDSLWESIDAPRFMAADKTLSTNSKFMILHNLNWFWYNESLWYKHLGYDQYQPNRTYQRKALMPMNGRRNHRDYLRKILDNSLDDFIWSYACARVLLPNGGDPVSDPSTQRAFDPAWYDNTCFSIVAESLVDSTDNQAVFITEKTFKPCAFEHPFMVLGNTGTLAYLKTQGFETFDEMFDQSYDDLPTWQSRAIAIKNNLYNYIKQPHSPLTLHKLQHNRDRFFDSQLIQQRLIKEIIEPMINHLEN